MEELKVVGLGGRIMAVLAVWLGVAVLGHGPRLSASFLTTLTPATQPAATAGCEFPTDLSEQPNSPPQRDAWRVFEFLDGGLQGSSGGSGSNSSPSSGSGSSTAMLEIGDAITGPSIGSPLRTREALLIPNPITAAILEPPRASA